MGIDTYVIENSKLKMIYFHLALAYEYKYGERPKVRGNWPKWFEKNGNKLTTVELIIIVFQIVIPTLIGRNGIIKQKGH